MKEINLASADKGSGSERGAGVTWIRNEVGWYIAADLT